MKTPVLALAGVVLIMLLELGVSRRNERRLRAAGAIEPPGDVYRWMRVVYPACFVAMTVEAVVANRFVVGSRAASLVGGRPSWWLMAGGLLFAASKILKAWAISSLGTRWSFRVLVLPGAPLVSGGPYRYLRHPNYVAIFGELAGMALMVRAPITGLASNAAFAVLLRKRIETEERALGLRG